ncbi:MAG: F0F1 ATP synthase subunit B family protein, partial [Alphaproteobacteria bacterium]
RFVILPRIGDLLDERQRRIEENLDKAASLKAEAEKVIADYEHTQAKAREQARALSKGIADEAAAEAARRHAELGEMLAERTKAAEARIAEAKTKALDGMRQAAVEVAQAATERLIGAPATAEDATRAVAEAFEERN